MRLQYSFHIHIDNIFEKLRIEIIYGQGNVTRQEDPLLEAVLQDLEYAVSYSFIN